MTLKFHRIPYKKKRKTNLRASGRYKDPQHDVGHLQFTSIGCEKNCDAFFNATCEGHQNRRQCDCVTQVCGNHALELKIVSQLK
jgi:hypothetical protein